MSVAELIQNLMRRIKTQHYRDRDREFYRDTKALHKAIARYGYECDRRDWPFEAEQICRDINELLDEIKKYRADIKYLPVYLENAIDRRIRIRAEEYAGQAKKIKHRIYRAMQSLPEPQETIRRMTPTETLAELYRNLVKRKSRQQVGKQLELIKVTNRKIKSHV